MSERNSHDPKTGWYVDWRGERCFVIVSREPKLGEEGAVRVEYDDGSWTSAYFSTFKRWGYRPSPTLQTEGGKP